MGERDGKGDSRFLSEVLAGAHTSSKGKTFFFLPPASVDWHLSSKLILPREPFFPFLPLEGIRLLGVTKMDGRRGVHDKIGRAFASLEEGQEEVRAQKEVARLCTSLSLWRSRAFAAAPLGAWLLASMFVLLCQR